MSFLSVAYEMQEREGGGRGRIGSKKGVGREKGVNEGVKMWAVREIESEE